MLPRVLSRRRAAQVKMGIPTRTLFSTTAASPWNAIASGQGVLKMLDMTATSLNGILTIFDSLTASGTIIAKWNPGNAGSSALGRSRLFTLPYSVGLSMSYSQAITGLFVATVSPTDNPQPILFSSSSGALSYQVATGPGVLKGITVLNGITAQRLSIQDGVGAGPVIGGMGCIANGNDHDDFDLPFTDGLFISLPNAPLTVYVTYTTS